MKPPKMYFASSIEQHAFEWFKRNNRGKWLQRALEEVAYDPFHAKTDWQHSRGIFFAAKPGRAVWVRWSLAPFGNDDMNRKQIRAIQCIRRNVYFRDIARSIGIEPRRRKAA